MSKRFIERPAEANDAEQLSILFKDIPQEGRIQLVFQREPNYFNSAQTTSTQPDVWVIEDSKNKQLAAIFSMGTRPVYVDGTLQQVRYGSDLRIGQAYQGGRTLFRVAMKYKDIIQDSWMQTVILDGNDASLSTVSSGRLTLPTYHKAGRHRTNLIELKKRHTQATNTTVRRATNADVALMQQFFNTEAPKKQFYPHYEFDAIGTANPYYQDIALNDYFLAFDGDELVGMASVWDQKNFKQTKVAAYTGGMQLARHINNVASSIIGGLTLPPAGSMLSYINLHTIVCRDNSVDIFTDLIRTIRAEYKDSIYDALVLGFDERDPLHQVANQYRGTTLYSQHFLVSFGENPYEQMDQSRLNYLETARL